MSGYFPSYGLEIIANKLEVMGLWNGWPAHKSRHASDVITTSTRLNAFTLEGKNVLSVLAKPLGDAVDDDAFVHVRLFHMLADDEMTFLYGHSWRSSLRPLVKDEPVEIARHEISLVRTFGRWQWEDARPYMPEDRPAVVEVVQRVRDAIANADFETYADLCSVKLEETARATGRQAAPVREESIKLLKGFAEFEGWDVDPIDEQKLELESASGGRLVIVRGPDDKPPIRAFVGGSGPMAFNLTLSRVAQHSPAQQGIAAQSSGAVWMPVR